MKIAKIKKRKERKKGTVSVCGNIIKESKRVE